MKDLDALLSEELLALSEFVNREGTTITESFIDNNLPGNLQFYRDEVQSFATSLVPAVFELILQQWNSAKLSLERTVTEDIRSELEYVSGEASSSGIDASLMGMEETTSPTQSDSTTSQDVQDLDAPSLELVGAEMYRSGFDTGNLPRQGIPGSSQWDPSSNGPPFSNETEQGKPQTELTEWEWLTMSL